MKYAFIIEPQPIWNEATKDNGTFQIKVYDLETKEKYVDVPTHHVFGYLHEVKYLKNGKLSYKVDGAYFLDVPFVPTWKSIKTLEVHAQRWVKLVGWGKSIYATDDLNTKF